MTSYHLHLSSRDLRTIKTATVSALRGVHGVPELSEELLQRTAGGDSVLCTDGARQAVHALQTVPYPSPPSSAKWT